MHVQLEPGPYRVKVTLPCPQQCKGEVIFSLALGKRGGFNWFDEDFVKNCPKCHVASGPSKEELKLALVEARRLVAVG